MNVTAAMALMYLGGRWKPEFKCDAPEELDVLKLPQANRKKKKKENLQ